MKEQTILLIDDDEDEHFIFCTALKELKANYDCSIAHGWQRAKQILSTTVPDFIFLDYNMPEMNGIACLKEIKQKKEFSTVPVYLYSTGMSDDVCNKARAIGAKDCIKKTSSIHELVRILEPILS